MQYTITEINKEQGWVALTVIFDDGIAYDKKMMAPMDSEDSIHGAIKQWLADYAPMREANKNSYDPSGLTSKTFSVSGEDLPKTSVDQAAEQGAALTEQKVQEVE